MGKYIAKRILLMIPVVLGVTILLFTILYFTPGDPATIILGSTATREDIEALRESMGLNRPYLERLLEYISLEDTDSEKCRPHPDWKLEMFIGQ